jgi:hypothetical protein
MGLPARRRNLTDVPLVAVKKLAIIGGGKYGFHGRGGLEINLDRMPPDVLGKSGLIPKIKYWVVF